ncbi:hypothetical protein L209DRAFT_307219 [Thermothelomyces heterothallicus CBS 203.75]
MHHITASLFSSLFANHNQSLVVEDSATLPDTAVVSLPCPRLLTTIVPPAVPWQSSLPTLSTRRRRRSWSFLVESHEGKMPRTPSPSASFPDPRKEGKKKKKNCSPTVREI